MAYFANLNSENIVTHVEIVNDSHITPGDDAANETWCLENLTHVDGGVSWKETFKYGEDRVKATTAKGVLKKAKGGRASYKHGGAAGCAIRGVKKNAYGKNS